MAEPEDDRKIEYVANETGGNISVQPVYAEGYEIGRGLFVGGVVGYNYGYIIDHSYNAGSINVNASRNVNVGGIVGRLSLNNIQNTYNAGAILITSLLDTQYLLIDTSLNVGGIAGIVGENEQELGNEVMLQKLYNEGNITIVRNNPASGYGNENHKITFNVGGIIGTGKSTSVIESANMGQVTIDLNYNQVGYYNNENQYVNTTTFYIGGVAGNLSEILYWDGTSIEYLSNVANYANIRAELQARNDAMKLGGVVGFTYGVDTRNTLFSANIQFPSLVYPIYYGITGWDGTEPTISSSYFLSQTINGKNLEMSKEDETKHPGRGSTSSYWLKRQATYTGWDFTNIWSISEGVNYPWLRNITLSIDIADGSEAEPTIDLNSLPLAPQSF